MIFHSHYPDVTPPDLAFTPFVLQQARRLGDKPALIDGPAGRTLTYGQLADGVQRVAAGLAARGLRKGDVFAIFCPNLPEYALAFHAVASLGGILTTVNPLYTVEELAFQLRDTGARYLLTVPTFMDTARQAVAETRIEEIFVLGDAPGATSFDTLLQTDGPPPEVAIDPRKDVLLLPYSSGTTGLSKGVMLTHYNAVAHLCQVDAVSEPPGPDDVSLAPLPFFHIYGLILLLHRSLRRGITLVTMPRFEIEQFLQLLQDYGVKSVGLVPPIVLLLAKHPAVDKYDLSRLESIACGAAPLGGDVEEACATRLNCRVSQGYGLTEVTAAAAFSPPEPERIRRGSAGLLLPNMECKVMDCATGAELSHNQRGELWLRGPNVMMGYFHQPEATARTLDATGWLHTGDIGYVDDDGYVYVVDRLKELIKYKGMQVAPAELEAVLLTHPAVADAAVIGSPDEDAGEIPKAFVVRKAEASAAGILAYVAERVAPHKKIRALEFVEAIPKSASGKILRRVLVEQERVRALSLGPPNASR